MKRVIVIYFIGVVVSIILGFSALGQHKRATYGDALLICTLSTLSWVSAFAFGVVWLSESGFLDKPIFENTN